MTNSVVESADQLKGSTHRWLATTKLLPTYFNVLTNILLNLSDYFNSISD